MRAAEFPVNGGLDVLEAAIHAGQDFPRVRQIDSRPARGNSTTALDHIGLGRFVEIDHHIAAKDQWEKAQAWKFLNQIETAKRDCGRDFLPDPIQAPATAFTAQNVFAERVERQIAEALHGVYALLSGRQDARRNPGGQDVELRQTLYAKGIEKT